MSCQFAEKWGKVVEVALDLMRLVETNYLFPVWVLCDEQLVLSGGGSTVKLEKVCHTTVQTNDFAKNQCTLSRPFNVISARIWCKTLWRCPTCHLIGGNKFWDFLIGELKIYDNGIFNSRFSTFVCFHDESKHCRPSNLNFDTSQ